ncbi:MAG: 16S rRNA (guanine(527)-N(7))-methyltransferase RsmG [Lachnospira sp.]|nr:16S rRNA (guanine(527)-N(7))-methyltransferase RsmG [Lachnospira sp.]
MKNNQVFKEHLKQVGVELTNLQHEQLDKYYEILVEWNEFMNLTGITEYDEVNQKHFVDSLVLKTPMCGYVNQDIANYLDLKIENVVVEGKGLRFINDKEIDQNSIEHFKKSIKQIDLLLNKSDIKLIDVGTGAGFPGLPLKIAYPEMNVVLLDSLNKRIKFLDEVINQLKLKNVKAVHGRAEEAARNKEYREQFDISVSRAVANLASLVEYNLPFVKIGGYFIAYKSGTVDEELMNSKKAVQTLGGEIDLVCRFHLPDSDIERSLVFVRKVKSTSKKYPRKAGLPTKEPIA